MNAELLFKANRAIGDFRSSLLLFNPFHNPKARKRGRLVLVLCREPRVGASVFFLHCGIIYSLTVFFAAQR